MRPRLLRLAAAVSLVLPASATAQRDRVLPPLPDSTGWGVHVLTAARDSQGAVWVGTYGRGIWRLPPGDSSWQRIASDTSGTSISWDFVHAIAFGPRGQVWYGTVGNGWGMSTDGGRTWRNWTFKQLGPEWQYVATDGIVTRGDTTIVATADGLQITTDDGAHWLAVGDSTGPAAKGPADSALALLASEYVVGARNDAPGVRLETLRGTALLVRAQRGWAVSAVQGGSASHGRRPRAGRDLVIGGRPYLSLPCGLFPNVRRGDLGYVTTDPCYGEAKAAGRPTPPAAPRTTWFRRPIDSTDNHRIDQTYRYGSTMGGNFQQHQGVEFNNPDGTRVHAIGAGEVVYAGRAEAGALTVAVRHDTTVTDSAGRRLGVYSVYYHNSALEVKAGDRVRAGQLVARVGHTGRATNDHLHLEVHTAPADTVRARVGAIVDSLNRFPAYTTNPELWIRPLPGTGIVAGQVWGADGSPVPQARIYGLVKPLPAETPYSFAETYGDKAHPHPLYREHFAVGDVPPGTYVLGTEIGGRKVFRRVEVQADKVTWVEFR